MVSTDSGPGIVSNYKRGAPPRDASDYRVIQANHPLYPITDVLEHLQAGGKSSLQVITKKCGRDMRDEGLDLQDVFELVKFGLSNGKFVNAQWCQVLPPGAWCACDSYEIAGPSGDLLYIKLAFNEVKSKILLVSCHPSTGSQEHGESI